ncbi:hypothetical protein ACVINI_005461 [Rhizobium beringeri]
MAAEAAALFGIGRQDLYLPGPFALLRRLAANDTPAILAGKIGILLRQHGSSQKQHDRRNIEDPADRRAHSLAPAEV